MFEAVFDKFKKIHRLIRVSSRNVLEHAYTPVAHRLILLPHRELTYSNLALIDTILSLILSFFAQWKILFGKIISWV